MMLYKLLTVIKLSEITNYELGKVGRVFSCALKPHEPHN